MAPQSDALGDSTHIEKLLEVLRQLDSTSSGKLSQEVIFKVLKKIGVEESVAAKLLSASGCLTQASGDVDYCNFARWLFRQSHVSEDPGLDEKPEPPRSLERVSCGHSGFGSWVDRCAQILEERSEADFVAKKQIVAQVSAYLNHIAAKNKEALPKPMTTSAAKPKPFQSYVDKLKWDGPSLVQFLLDDGPNKIPQSSMDEVLDAVLEVLPSSGWLDGQKRAVVRWSVPDDGKMVVVGDTHGQLQDVLLIFMLYGMPTSKNVYLFNGDVADRGPHACAIFLLIFTFWLCDPSCICLNRGNHEDNHMNAMSADNGGGFFAECKQKYGSDMYLKFVKIFKLLPIACVVDKELLVVHGGLGKGPPQSLAFIESIPTRHVCCPAPDASSKKDQTFISCLWSDPSESLGCTQSPRGTGCLWGPDVTEAFLHKNHLQWMIRSHQLPHEDRGWMEHHLGRVVTVFSASNYCGTELNWGGVILLTCKPEGGLHAAVKEHNAPNLDVLPALFKIPAGPERETACRKAGLAHVDEERVVVGQRRVDLTLRQLAGFVLEHKSELWQAFHEHDEKHTGTVDLQTWLNCLSSVCGDELPWEAAMQHWIVQDQKSPAEVVDYLEFLDHFHVTLNQERWCGWKRLIMTDVYHQLLDRNNTAQEIMKTFDANADGFVSVEEFTDVISNLTQGCLSQPQLQALSRTVFKHAQGNSLNMNEFLGRFTVAFAQTEGMIALAEKNSAKESDELSSAQLEAILELIGRLLFQNRPSGQSKAEFRISSCFAEFDDSKDGYLQNDEFTNHISKLPGFDELRFEGKPLDCMLLRKVAKAISRTPDGKVNLLEFYRAFSVIDASGGLELEDDIQEHILTFLYRHRHALQCGCMERDPASSGHVSKDVFASVLEAVNVSVSRPERHLVQPQIDALVESLAEDDGSVEYEEFLESFVIQTI